MTYLVKSAVAKRYYEMEGIHLDNEAARKRFNEAYVNFSRLLEVMKTVGKEEIEMVKKKRDEEGK